MFQLPVSGSRVALRQPAGAEDVLLLEAAELGPELAIALLSRLAESDQPIAWDALCVTDIEALLLHLRRIVLGDRVRTDMRCPPCGTRVDLSFKVLDYLQFRAPRRPRNSEPAPDPGWFRLRGEEVTFRLPTSADQIAAARASDPRQALIERCVRLPATTPQSGRDAKGRLLKKVESAMESLGPSYSGELAGDCPQCSARVETYFDVLLFVLGELRNGAAFIFEEVHLLARHYHWSEETILALPRKRRLRYAQLLQQEAL